MAELEDMALWDKWLEQVILTSPLPALQQQWTHQQILDVAWEQTVSVMMPMLIMSSPRFRREVYDITLVADQAEYQIPEHAMLRKIYMAALLNTDGQQRKLERREPPEAEFFYVSASGHPITITVHDDIVELNPAPSTSDILQWPSLRTFIHRRPGRFVRATDDGSGNNPARAARVLTSAASTVTYTTLMPSSFDASSEHDFYSQTEPHKRLATAVAATGAPTTSSQTFAAATAELLTAGDYVCLKGETCFMPVPVDMGRHIRDLVIFSAGKTQQDKDSYQMALDSLQRDVMGMFNAAADPMPGNPLKQTLLHSPFLVGTGVHRGRRMVRD